MDSKLLKSALKSAVECLKEDKFTETVKICKKVLSNSPGNSRALVFLGKAAEGLDDQTNALAAYKKAAESAPDDLLPWQGLCSFYEKHTPHNAEELTRVYDKLSTLYTGNESKLAENKVKRCRHLLSQPTYDPSVAESARELLNEIKDSAGQYKVKLSLARYYMKSTNEDSLERFREVCEDLLRESSFPSEELDLWEFYASHLYQVETELDKVVERSVSLSARYPSSAIIHLILAEIYAHTRLAQVFDMELDSNVPDPALSVICAHLKTGDDLSQAFSIDKLRNSVLSLACLVLSQYHLAHNSYSQVIECLKSAEMHVPNIPPCLAQCSRVYRSMILDKKIKVAFKQRSYSDVVSLCRKATDGAHREELVLSLIETGATDEVKQLLDVDSLEDQGWLGYLNLKLGLYEEAYKLLGSATSHAPSLARLNLWLGEVCYHMPSKVKEAAKHLLTAAKLDPGSERAFLYLGLYYNSVGDSQRGMKCIRKSYSLNPTDDEICIAYVDQLIAQANNEQALEILTQTTKLSSSGSCKWAWFRLGILRSNEGNYTEAINCYQQALRADEEDSNCWECLADCYVKRGSYTAAIGAFEKACEKNPNSIYSRYQIALTKHKLGLYADAQEQFLEILRLEPDYTPALKGVGDVHIAIAGEALKQSIYGKASKNISQALEYLSKAAVIRSDLSCLWKSLGDALTLSYQLPVDKVLRCPLVLTADSADVRASSSVDVDRAQALAIGARCYTQCRHLRADNSFVWHDLAVNLLYQSRLSAEAPRREALLRTASQCALKAISLDGARAAHYNLLGAIYMEPDMFDPLAAQHYLITGVEMDQSNVQGWTNLAALYLKQGEVTLAHEALKIAQSADPKYNECWTGQALVAEVMGHPETMDLFRHATELGENVESTLGYAHWVLSTLLDDRRSDSEHFRYSIERLEAVPMSSFGLGNLVARQPSAQSLNAYALLLERQGLLNMAVRALEECMRRSEEAGDDKLPLYRANLARVLCSRGDYEECLHHVSLISSPTANDISISSLAYFKLGRFSESFQGYSQLLDLIVSDAAKAHVLAAMGMLAVKCGDTETAKTAFFQCSQSSCPSIYGLAGLCSLALLTGDGELALAALHELVKCGESKEAFVLKCVFSSYMAALQGDTRSARNHLLKAIHRYPTDPQLHNQLVTMSISYLRGYRESILRLSQSVSSVQHLVGVACLVEGETKRALSRAQAAVHMYPDRHTNWSLLTSSASAKLNCRADNELAGTVLERKADELAGTAPEHKADELAGTAPEHKADELAGTAPERKADNKIVNNKLAATVLNLLRCTTLHKDHAHAKSGLRRWLAEMFELHTFQYYSGKPDELDALHEQVEEELKGSNISRVLGEFMKAESSPLSADPERFELQVYVGRKLKQGNICIAVIKELLNIARKSEDAEAFKIAFAFELLKRLVTKDSEEGMTDHFFTLLEGNDSCSAATLKYFYHSRVKVNDRLADKYIKTVVDQDHRKEWLTKVLAENLGELDKAIKEGCGEYLAIILLKLVKALKYRNIAPLQLIGDSQLTRNTPEHLDLTSRRGFAIHA